MSEKNFTDEQIKGLHYACTSFYSRKWQIPILLNLFTGPKHFGELLKNNEGMSKKMLSLNLHKLESKGVIAKTEYNDGAIRRVEYSLTDQGVELQHILEELRNWGVKYNPDNRKNK